MPATTTTTTTTTRTRGCPRPWLSLLLAALAATVARAHREHKVHNIVLYPDKESWCKTTPIKQVVTWPSCAPQELDNNVCVGACFSYMVPHSEPSAPGDLIRPYCDSCQPLDSIWHTVTLQCRDKEGQPTQMQKKVQIITNCSCSSCTESERIKPDLNSLLQSLELQEAAAAAKPRVPPPLLSRALEQQQQLQQQQTSTPEPAPIQTQTQTVVAAAAVEAPDEAAPTGAEAPMFPAAPQTQTVEPDEAPTHGQHELPDLLLDPNLNASAKLNVSGSEHRLPNERLLHYFKQLDEPDKLAGLHSLDKLGKLDKLASEEAGAKELLAKLSELLHKYRQTQEEAAVAGSVEPEIDEDEDEEEEKHKPLVESESERKADEKSESESIPAEPVAPSSTAAPAMLPPELPKDDDDEEVPSLQDQQLRVAESLLQRTGPHHSLVLDAGVKEKIDVDSHYLHPALAGQEISYHDNLLNLDKTKKKDF